MALTMVVTRDPALGARIAGSMDSLWHDVTVASRWAVARRRLRERPVAALVLDLRGIEPSRARTLLEGVGRRFPSVPVGVVGRAAEPRLLHELGRAGLGHLVLEEEGGPLLLAALVRDLHQEAAPGRVVRRLSPLMGRRGSEIVRGALHLTHRRPRADDLAAAIGVSRPRLGVRLRDEGLPSPGHLLGWARLFHAACWLPDPGRSAGSVGRQLDYHDGSGFRRALRRDVGATPGEVVDGGGLDVVLRAFRVRHGLEAPEPWARWVA